jgi:hypothetical protein
MVPFMTPPGTCFSNSTSSASTRACCKPLSAHSTSRWVKSPGADARCPLRQRVPHCDATVGLILSPWALLALPAVVLIALTFAAIGMTITSYLTTFQQMSWVNFALLPLFLFSGTFFPLDVYPEPAQWIVQISPVARGGAASRADHGLN